MGQQTKLSFLLYLCPLFLGLWVRFLLSCACKYVSHLRTISSALVLQDQFALQLTNLFFFKNEDTTISINEIFLGFTGHPDLVDCVCTSHLVSQCHIPDHPSGTQKSPVILSHLTPIFPLPKSKTCLRLSKGVFVMVAWASCFTDFPRHLFSLGPRTCHGVAGLVQVTDKQTWNW